VDEGDIVWIDFDPQRGHDQAAHRPAVILIPAAYTGRAGLIVGCPTTTWIEGYPFEVALSGQPHSVALADQVKSFDWRPRRAARKGRATSAELAEIRNKLRVLVS
jgi:mRNA interferase MazF